MKEQQNLNGQVWRDDEGELIQAHGGCIMAYDDGYWWYGENKDTATIHEAGKDAHVAFVGISCYFTRDFTSWKNIGLVLTAANDASGRLRSDSVVERPKVIYNQLTKKFVMWCHYDDPDYRFAGCLVAVSAAPTGPFAVVDVFRPNGMDSRDLTIFQEGNTAYLIHSANHNRTLTFAKLRPDYLNVDGHTDVAFVDQKREAPTIFKSAGWYFMITSGCTGWRPNPALFSRSRELCTGQKLIDNPCVGAKMRTTYDGQPAFVFQYQDDWYMLLDHWLQDNLRHSAYSILPIEINGRDLQMPWVDEPMM